MMMQMQNKQQQSQGSFSLGLIETGMSSNTKNDCHGRDNDDDDDVEHESLGIPSSTDRSSSSKSSEYVAVQAAGIPTWVYRLIDWLQKPRQFKVRSKKKKKKKTDGDDDHDTDDDDQGNDASSEIQLVSGLERVLSGSASAADAVKIVGVKPPPYLCYMLSGMSCDVLQFVLDVILYYGAGIQDASICWAITFTISIVPRHCSLRYMVFGNYVGGYWSSLGRMYAGFSFSIIVSTVFNIVIVRMAGISHYAAWIFTLIWTGIVNYFILKKLWSFGKVGASTIKK